MYQLGDYNWQEIICLYRSPSQNSKEIKTFLKNLDLNLEFIFNKNSNLTIYFIYYNSSSSSSSSSTTLTYSKLCADSMSLRYFCHHLRYSEVAGALPHHWCLGVGNPFWFCPPRKFFFFHTSVPLSEGIQQMLFSLVFFYQVLEGNQAMIIFSSLLDYSTSLPLSFHIILCPLLFSAISHPWLGKAAFVLKNQFYLQWFL